MYMKTRILFLMMIFSVVFLTCTPKNKIAKTPPPPPRPESQEVKKLSLSPWENKPAIKDDSKMSFFNEFEINVVGSIPNFTYQTNEGVLEKIDNSQKFDFKIPKETPGSLIDGGVIRNSSGVVTGIKVSYFDENDCYIIFSIERGSSYYFLESKAIVVFEGKPYKVDLSIVGNGGGRCRAFYDENSKDESTKKEKVATGKIIPGVQKLP